MIVWPLQGLRLLPHAWARTSWFTATGVLMLAIGQGSSMYLLGAINGFVLEPVSFVDAERLMYVGYEERNDAGDEQQIPLRDFVELRAAQTRFEHRAAGGPSRPARAADDGVALRMRMAS